MPDLDSGPETPLLHSLAAPIQSYLTVCWASPYCHQPLDQSLSLVFAFYALALKFSVV